MLTEYEISEDHEVFGRSLNDITNLSLDDSIDIRFAQNIPAPEVFLSAARIRAMAMEIMHGEMAKSKLRRLVSSKNIYKGSEVRPGDCVLFYRVATICYSGR